MLLNKYKQMYCSGQFSFTLKYVNRSAKSSINRALLVSVNGALSITEGNLGTELR